MVEDSLRDWDTLAFSSLAKLSTFLRCHWRKVHPQVSRGRKHGNYAVEALAASTKDAKKPRANALSPSIRSYTLNSKLTWLSPARDVKGHHYYSTAFCQIFAVYPLLIHYSRTIQFASISWAWGCTRRRRRWMRGRTLGELDNSRAK